MTDIRIEGVSYRYRRDVDALHDVTLDVPTGAIFGLLGSNGAGKTTLMQCVAGLRRPDDGRIMVGGASAAGRALIVRGVMGYVAEGVRLPGDLTLGQLECWLAPLHPRWDATLATALRERFSLDAARRIASLSRGEYMKAALLCALAAQPRVLLMDEPFTGIDVVTKDELLRGLLASAGASGTTVLLASHDIAEIETVLSHAAILTAGRVRLAGAMDVLRARYQRVTMVGGDEVLASFAREQQWLQFERAGRVVSIVADGEDTPLDQAMLGRRFAAADSITVEELTLRDLFSSVVRSAREHTSHRGAA